MDALADAIEGFYRAFSDVARPLHIDGCPCCIDTERIELLLATPLRQIAPDDLTSYASLALLTVGDVWDYLYFLPRIVEITVREDWWWPDIEVTAKAIHSTNLQSWSILRREALGLLIDAVIDDTIGSGVYVRIDSWLCAIALMELDVTPYLARIEKNPDAVLQYFEDNAECLREGRLHDGFWKLPNVGHDLIVQWFNSERTRKIPFEAYGYQF